MFRLRLGAVVDGVLDTLEADPAFRSFTLDGQGIVLEDYAEVRPDNVDRLRALLAAGRLEAGPWYVLPDEILVGSEALVRNLLVGRRVCRRFGVEAAVLPMTDERVRTRFTTDGGELSFQEYFVRERLAPVLRRIDFEGIESAKPTPEVVSALASADLVVIGPSNPLISIAPILRVLGAHVPRDRTIAVAPIVGGVALKGPTVAMMRALGFEASPIAVAQMYAGIADTFVVDSRDAALAPAIEALGYRAMVVDTVMTDGGRGLAASILA